MHINIHFDTPSFFFLLQRNFLKEQQYLKNLKNDADDFTI